MCADSGGEPRRGRRAAPITDEQVRAVQRICRARVRPADVDDATQETLLQYLLADHSRIDKPNAWLATVAVRVCAKVHRRRYRSLEAPMTEELLDTSQDPSDRAISDVLLQQIVAALPEADRLILSRVYFDDLSFAQLAAELHVTESHARVLAFRARRRAARIMLAPPAGTRDADECARADVA